MIEGIFGTKVWNEIEGNFVSVSSYISILFVMAHLARESRFLEVGLLQFQSIQRSEPALKIFEVINEHGPQSSLRIGFRMA